MHTHSSTSCKDFHSRPETVSDRRHARSLESRHALDWLNFFLAALLMGAATHQKFGRAGNSRDDFLASSTVEWFQISLSEPPETFSAAATVRHSRCRTRQADERRACRPHARRLNDLLRDQLGHPIFRGHGELKLGAQASKAPCMAWLESESTGLITTELLDGLELGRGTRVHRDPSLTFRGGVSRGLRTRRGRTGDHAGSRITAVAVKKG
jgi:hypothetical protein